MLRTIGRAVDAALLDPYSTAVAGKNPASLTANGTLVATTGSTLAAILTDVESLLVTLSNAGSDLNDVVLALHPASAVRISRLQIAGGLAPTIGARGGTLLGVPALTSVGAEASGSPTEKIIAAIDPNAAIVASGDLDVLPGKFSALQMVDTPAASAQSLVSAFQTGTTPLRFTRYVNWASVAARCCAYLRITW
jgi:hypothetical protein